MPAKKRIKLEAISAVPGASDVAEASVGDCDEWKDCAEELIAKATGDELPFGPEEQVEPEAILQRKEEVPAFHELLVDRNFLEIAEKMMKYKGFDIDNEAPTGRLLDGFCMRYHPGISDANAKTMWTLSFEESVCSGQGCGWYMFKATLTMHLLRDRKFEGEWVYHNKRMAERSAIVAFRDDPEVQEIAAWLPPGQKCIRNNIKPKPAEKEAALAHGIHWTVLHKELIKQLFLRFRDLGCRTALWDGHA